MTSLATLISALLMPAHAAAAPVVAVFPTPGSRVASPSAQIAFRGAPVSALGPISVSGSRSGPHPGVLRGDSDGRGGSFLPAKRFLPGERVTVSTRLSVLGGLGGTFGFSVARPAPQIRLGIPINAPRISGDVFRFHSRPDLAPPAVVVTKRAPGATTGDIFLGPQQGPVQRGPMVLGPSGRLIWFKPLGGNETADDVDVQRFRGRPVLTWWQGRSNYGVGSGVDVIDDSSYRQIAAVHGGNGLGADLHDFQITPQNTALITAYFPVWWNASSARGAKVQLVQDSVVQEIDIPTGLVLFQWDSLDHVDLRDTHVNPPPRRTLPFDYFHVNSVDLDPDGNLVLSARNTWAAYKVSRLTGQIIWTLGGRHSNFTFGRGASFAFQHDVRVRAAGDSLITMFDNGAGPPNVHSHSRGLELSLDFGRMTATRVSERSHSPGLLAAFEGNFEWLPDGHSFFGWGQQSYFTEFDAGGRIVFDAHFVGPDSDYRVFRAAWTGTPHTAPAIAASGGRHPTVYASWNGATEVARWRVLGGSHRRPLRRVATAPKNGFETWIRVPRRSYYAVQALDARGRVLGRSRTIRGR